MSFWIRLRFNESLTIASNSDTVIAMLTAEQLKELLASTESDRIERTISTSNTVKFREAICSFANDMPEHGKPGYLLVGVNDDGTLNSGVRITDQLMQDFASYRDDGHILPQPMMKVFKQPHPDGGEFLMVEYNQAIFLQCAMMGGLISGWGHVGPGQTNRRNGD